MNKGKCDVLPGLHSSLWAWMAVYGDSYRGAGAGRALLQF